MKIKTYDILELNKMAPGELENIALYLGLNPEGFSKQVLIYKILDQQQEILNG